MPAPKRESRLSHDRRILLMALASALPGAAISLIFLWTGDFTPKVQWTLTVLILAFCLGFAFALRERVVLPLQTLSNLLAALGEGDFSIRARGARGGDPLGEVMIEVNALVETLRHQRLDALEATTLLRKVMAEIDVAVFTFDEEQELTFVNRAGARLLSQPSERLLGRRASDLDLADCLRGEAPRVINTAFPGGVGRWEIRRSTFRQGGRPHVRRRQPDAVSGDRAWSPESDRFEIAGWRGLVRRLRGLHFVRRFGQMNEYGNVLPVRKRPGRLQCLCVQRIHRMRSHGWNDEVVGGELLDEPLRSGQALSGCFCVRRRKLNDGLTKHASESGFPGHRGNFFFEVIHIRVRRRARLNHLERSEARAGANELRSHGLGLGRKDVLLQPVHDQVPAVSLNLIARQLRRVNRRAGSASH